MIGWLIETLLATSLLMLAVLLLRNPVRQAFGSTVAYALWALPVLRLVLPPLPGEWQLSALVTPLIDPTTPQAALFGMARPDRSPDSIASQALLQAQMNLAEAPMGMATMPPVAAADGPGIVLFVIGFWVIGALAFLIYHLVAHRAFCHRIQQQARRRSRVTGAGVEVIETDAATGPLAFGIWHKYIAFPCDFEDRYDSDERELALVHELTHHARGDLIANWVALVVLALHWFNPLAWRAFRAFRADQEMACDARVLAGRSPAFIHAYGRAIVKSAHGGAVSAACHLHTINDLKGRLKMLSTKKKSPGRIMGGALSVVAVTLGGLVLTASGTQAAEGLREKVDTTIGSELAKLDRLASNVTAPRAPMAPLAPIAAQAAPSVPTVPVPPSAATPADQSTPPAPPEALEVDAPTPPSPPSTPHWGSHSRVIVLDRKGKAPKGFKGLKEGREMRFVFRDKGDLATVLSSAGPGSTVSLAIDECRDGKGDGAAKEGKTVTTRVVDGKKVTIVCELYGKRLAMNARLHTARAEEMGRIAEKMAERMAFRAPEIERNAYRSALDGVRNARAGMVANKNLTGEARASALKAMDEAIAELEANLSKVN